MADNSSYEGGNWTEWSRHVRVELTRLSDQSKDAQKIIMELREEVAALKVKASIMALREDIAGLKVKASIWGAVAGIMAALGALMLQGWKGTP